MCFELLNYSVQNARVEGCLRIQTTPKKAEPKLNNSHRGFILPDSHPQKMLCLLLDLNHLSRASLRDRVVGAVFRPAARPLLELANKDLGRSPASGAPDLHENRTLLQ